MVYLSRRKTSGCVGSWRRSRRREEDETEWKFVGWGGSKTREAGVAAQSGRRVVQACSFHLKRHPETDDDDDDEAEEDTVRSELKKKLAALEPAD